MAMSSHPLIGMKVNKVSPNWGKAMLRKSQHNVFCYLKFKEQLTMRNGNEKIVSNAKILVVEDNLINSRVMTLLLQECGIKHIVLAENGKEALASFSSDFNMAILDIGLPDISGIELCRSMRATLNGKPMPIIACTADHSNEQACKKAGFTDYIVKPINLNIMQRIIRTYL